MKKNKLIFFSLILVVVFATIGCTAQPNNLDRTQTRIGRDNNNALRRNNNLNNRDNRNNMGLNDNMRNMDDNLLDREDTVERNRLGNNIVGNDGLNNNNNNNGMNNNRNNNAQRARQIADGIEDIQGINRAYVLLSGDTAIVGVNMNNEAEGQVTRDLKQKIERTVRRYNEDIDNVSVTADPDLLTRIQNMFEDMDEGNPIEGFADEFQEIFRRITPMR